MITAAGNTGIQVHYEEDATPRALPGFFMLDRMGNIRLVNQAGAALLGYSLPELEGALLGLFVSERSRQEWVVFWENVSAGAITEGASVVLELQNKNKKDFPAVLSVVKDISNSADLHHASLCIEIRELRANRHEGYGFDDLSLKDSGEKTQASSTLAQTIAQIEVSKKRAAENKCFSKSTPG